MHPGIRLDLTWAEVDGPRSTWAEVDGPRSTWAEIDEYQ